MQYHLECACAAGICNMMLHVHMPFHPVFWLHWFSRFDCLWLALTSYNIIRPLSWSIPATIAGKWHHKTLHNAFSPNGGGLIKCNFQPRTLQVTFFTPLPPPPLSPPPPKKGGSRWCNYIPRRHVVTFLDPLPPASCTSMLGLGGVSYIFQGGGRGGGIGSYIFQAPPSKQWLRGWG